MLVRAIMHPSSEQVMGNCKWMGSGEAIGMFPLDHQGRFTAIEPARILEFRTIDNDILVGGAGGASDHQR